jgi:hypothetical protein
MTLIVTMTNKKSYDAKIFYQNGSNKASMHAVVPATYSVSMVDNAIHFFSLKIQGIASHVKVKNYPKADFLAVHMTKQSVSIKPETDAFYFPMQMYKSFVHLRYSIIPFISSQYFLLGFASGKTFC